MKLSLRDEQMSSNSRVERRTPDGRAGQGLRARVPQWAGFRRPRLRTSGRRYFDQSGRISAIGAVAVVAVAAMALSYSVWGRDSLIGSLIEGVGQCLLIAAVLGRLWSTLYIGGRKNASLITTGPYSLSRNPLYFFSTLGAVGAGLVFGSLAVGLLLGGATYALLGRVARGEARMLSNSFGPAYAAYAANVPLMWPRLSRYEDAAEPSFRPTALGRALRDGLLFLALLPLAEIFDHARAAGRLPQLIPLF